MSSSFTPQHPSRILTPAQVSLLRKWSSAAEAAGQLHGEQLELVHRQKWFHLFVPEKLGGLELDLMQGLQVQEALAWADGSVGWTVTLCSGASWFAGFLQPEAAQKIFAADAACLAGSGAVGGVAAQTNEGFVVSGHWPHASGAPHATVFTGNCHIERNGELLLDAKGDPVFYPFWFLREEVTLHSNWKTTGMKATGSHAFSVNDCVMGTDRRFCIDAEHAVVDQAMYRIPFLPFAEATLAVNLSGMALHFLELFLAWGKGPAFVFQTDTNRNPVKELEHQFEQVRYAFYHTVAGAWTELETRGSLSEKRAQEVSNRSMQLAAICLSLVNRLYPLAGLGQVETGSEMDRVWRDVHTASQHPLFRPAWMQGVH